MSKAARNEMDTKLDIGGIELNYQISGASNDGPTLVFDSGYGCALENWDSIKDDISKFSKMFTYDRATRTIDLAIVSKVSKICELYLEKQV